MTASDKAISLESTSEAQAEIENQSQALRSGANWFYWIAGLSIVNSLVQLFQGEWGFVIGLGITQAFDGFAASFSEGVEPNIALIIRGFALVMDILVALVFVFFGWMAGKKKGWAFVTGMILYLLDGAIFLLVQDWLSIGFHGFALFCIFGGYSALKRLKEAEVKAGGSEIMPHRA